MRKLFAKIFLLLSSLFLIANPFFLTIANASSSFTVSATVAAHQSDFSVQFTTTNANTVIHENKQIDYTITYGSSLTNATSMTLTADWSQAQAEGVTIFDYVTNSAGSAINNTQPVIDLTAHTITWSISSIPANSTNNTVSFSLVTNNLYTKDVDVSLPVSVTLSSSGVTLPT